MRLMHFFILQNPSLHSKLSFVFEMLLGLAVTDLPFRTEVQEPTYDYVQGTPALNMYVHSPTIVFSRQIKESMVQSSALAVSTNYFDPEGIPFFV